MISIAIKLSLAIATVEVLGWLVGYWLYRLPFWERTAIYFGLGLGSMSIILMSASLIGVPLNSSSTYIINLIIWIVAILKWRRPRAVANKAYVRKISLSGFELITRIIIIIFIIVSALNIGYRALARPLTSWDDRAIWGSKAKIIYYEKTIMAEGFTEQFRLHPHKDYPLLVPLSEYYFFSTLRDANDRLVKVIFIGLFFSVVAITYFHIKGVMGGTAALAAALILISMPAFGLIDIGAPSGYADVPLTFYYGAGSIYALSWLRGHKPHYAYLAFIFISMAVLTKNEGLGMAAIVIVLMLILTKPSRENISVLIKGLSVGVIISGFWLALKVNYQVSWENYGDRLHIANVVAGRGRITNIIKLMIDEFLKPLRWGRLYPIALLSIFLSPLSLFKRDNLFLFLNIIGTLLMYMIIYIITPWEFKSLIRASFTRLLMPLAPIVVLLIFYQLRSVLKIDKSIL